MITRSVIAGVGAIVLSVGAIATPLGPLVRAPGKTDTGRTISLETNIACAPDRAFALWSTSAGAESFLAPKATIDGQAGGQYTVAFSPADDPEGLAHGTAGARVLLSEPNRVFAFEWIVFAGDRRKGSHSPPYAPPSQRIPDPLPTWVELRFAPTAGGTHVRFEHYGFGDGPLWDESRAWFTKAWSGVLERMKGACSSS